MLLNLSYSFASSETVTAVAEDYTCSKAIAIARRDLAEQCRAMKMSLQNYNIDDCYKSEDTDYTIEYTAVVYGTCVHRL